MDIVNRLMGVNVFLSSAAGGVAVKQRVFGFTRPADNESARRTARKRRPGLTWIDYAVWGLYSIAVLVACAHHQTWADEAQAWLLVRDVPLSSIFGTYLHYEGSPGLFHLVLWILCRLHLTFKGMQYAMGIIAIAGIGVFLRYSPFPTIIRAVLPFTFYLCYQYAVIARSYVAVPLLVFAIAALIGHPRKNVFGLAVVLGLLANLCAQGFALSAGFAFLAWHRIYRERPVSAGWKRPVIAACVLGAFWSVAIVTAWPVKDNMFTPSPRLLHVLWKHAADESPNADTGYKGPADLQPVEPHLSKLEKVEERFNRLYRASMLPITDIPWLSVAIVAVFAAYLFSTGQLLNLLPYLFLQLFFVLIVARSWHWGLGLVALIGILWISWPGAGEPNERMWARVLSAALLAMAVIQIGWTVRAIRTDLTGSYSGDRETAEFLKQRVEGKHVAGFDFWSIGVLPYFDSNIFENQHKEGFWLWSKSQDPDDRVDETMASHPDYVVIGAAFPSDGSIATNSCPQVSPGAACPFIETHILSRTAYRETHRFCGHAFSGGDYSELECQLILEPYRR